MASWFDDKIEAQVAKSKLFHDVLTPAASFDCLHIPHIGELHSRWKKVCQAADKVVSFCETAQVDWEKREETIAQFISLRKEQDVANSKYVKSGGRLVRG